MSTSQNVTVIEDEKKGDKTATPQSLYTKAEALLREKHQAEFNEILNGLYEKAGMTRKKRLTAAEREAAKREAARVKAQAELTKIHAEFPDLFGEASADAAEGTAEAPLG